MITNSFRISLFAAAGVIIALIISAAMALTAYAQTTGDTGATTTLDAGGTVLQQQATPEAAQAPGLPNTGFGGDVGTNIALLAVSGLLIGFTAELLLKRYPR